MRPSAEGLLDFARNTMRELLRSRQHFESITVPVACDDASFGLAKQRTPFHVCDQGRNRVLAYLIGQCDKHLAVIFA